MLDNSVTGGYQRKNTDVGAEMARVLNKNNPYMQQADTRGKKVANRRGLLNSTMGVSAIEDSRISAALPIASQTAAQNQQSNIQDRAFKFQDKSEIRQIGAQREFLGTELDSRERLSGNEINSRERMQGLDIGSRERLQTQTIEANREFLERELGSRSQLQDAEQAAARERLGMQLTSQEQQALQQLQAAQGRLDTELESRERMQGADLALQDRLSTLNLSAQERAAAGQLAQAYEASYSNMVAAIMSNADIPANERQRYLNHASNIRDSNLRLLEQFYGIELSWGQPAGTPTPPGINPGPGYFPGGFPGRLTR